MTEWLAVEDALPMGTKMKIIIITGGEERIGRKPNRSASTVLYGGGWYTRRQERWWWWFGVSLAACRLHVQCLDGRSFVRAWPPQLL